MAPLPALDRAIRAARRGHPEAARRLLDGVLEAEPADELALTWRARVEDDAPARAALLRRVLEVNPDNRWAADALEALGDVGPASPSPSRSLDEIGARAATVEHLQCPNCGGQVEVHPERGPEAVACTHCGSVLDLTSGQLDILGQVDPLFDPGEWGDIRPGTEGTFEGERHLVIGWLRYEGWDSEDRWQWDEWQLVSDGGAVRYLSHSPDEGFLLQTPVRPTPRVTEGGIVLPGGRVPFHEVGPARIVAMRGELTWRPRLGEELRVGEAQRGDVSYSAELTADEVEVVAGPRLSSIGVWRALGLTDRVEAFEGRARRREERAAAREARARPRRRAAASMAWVFAVAAVAFAAVAVAVVPRLGQTVSEAEATYQSDPVALPPYADAFARDLALHDTVEVGAFPIAGGAAHVVEVAVTSPVAPAGARRGLDVDVAFVSDGGAPVFRAPVPDLVGPVGSRVSAASRPFQISGAPRALRPMRQVLLVRREWSDGAEWAEPVSFAVSATVRRVWMPGPFWAATGFMLLASFLAFSYSRSGPR